MAEKKPEHVVCLDAGFALPDHWSNAMFLIDVVNVISLGGHRLELTFKDGLTAVVDLDRIIYRFDGVFAPLKDPNYFRLVRVDPEIGTIVWPNGADLCLDVLYSYASGKPIIVNGERVLN